jgi:hypothetical protein
LPVKTEDILDFAQNPRDALKGAPNGGDILIWRVRTIATAGREGLKIVDRMIRLSNLNQKQSLGEGLARAAVACEILNSEVTTRIADMLRGSADEEVIRAFTTYLSSTTETEPSDAVAPPESNAKRLPDQGRIEGAGAYFGVHIHTDTPSAGF